MRKAVKEGNAAGNLSNTTFTPKKAGKPYVRLAMTNLKNQRRLYIPYMLACAGCVCMFYIMMFLICNAGLEAMNRATLNVVISLGAIVIALFSAIILLYSNSFVMKQRKREFGLYSVLGMERRHISRILFIETVVATGSSLILGISFGILFSKLVLLLFAKLLQVGVPFGFEIPAVAVFSTVALFAVIFLLTFIINAGRVRLTSVLSLINSASTGEREPKYKWFLTIIGVLTLALGYGLAVFVKNPIYAMLFFFFAVILVIIATYCLFIAGSVTILKRMKRTPSFYYKAKNFISTSGLLYRMKQNAAGLANICILSTMALVMISTTTCLYSGLEDSLRTMYPRNVEVEGGRFSTDKQYDSAVQLLLEAKNNSGIETKNMALYRRLTYTMRRDGTVFSVNYSDTLINNNIINVVVIPLEDYNRLNSSNRRLSQGEALIYTTDKSYNEDSITLNEYTLQVVGNADKPATESYSSIYGGAVYYVIVPDTQTLVAIDSYSSHDGYYSFYLGMDVDPSEEERLSQLMLAAMDSISSSYDYNYGNSESPYSNPYLYIRRVSPNRADLIGAYGGLFFLGIMLGVVFIMGTTLIMYYKQISEGYEDRHRYAIMRKVGLSKQEVKRSIRSQALLVFFMPLITAGVHVLFAFPMITRLFLMLSMNNASLFFICTLVSFAVFSLLYYTVYKLTARTYYKIVCFE